MNFELLAAGVVVQLLAVPLTIKAEAVARIIMICGAASVLYYAAYDRDFVLFSGQLLITFVVLKK